MKLHLPSNNFSWNGIHCRRNVMILTICLNYRSGIRWVHCSTSTRTLFLPWWFCTPGNAASSPVVSIYGHSSVPVAPPPQTTQVVAVFVQFFPGPSLAFSTSDNYADHHLVCAIYLVTHAVSCFRFCFIIISPSSSRSLRTQNDIIEVEALASV